MKQKKMNHKQIIYLIITIILLVFWLVFLTLTYLGAFTSTVAESIEEFLKLNLDGTKDYALLDFSKKYLFVTTVLLIISLIPYEFKKRYIFKK